MRITEEQRAEGFQPTLGQGYEGGHRTSPPRCVLPITPALRGETGARGQASGPTAERCASAKGRGLEMDKSESLPRQTATGGPCRAQPHRTSGQVIPKAGQTSHTGPIWGTTQHLEAPSS